MDNDGRFATRRSLRVPLGTDDSDGDTTTTTTIHASPQATDDAMEAIEMDAGGKCCQDIRDVLATVPPEYAQKPPPTRKHPHHDPRLWLFILGIVVLALLFAGFLVLAAFWGWFDSPYVWVAGIALGAMIRYSLPVIKERLDKRARMD